MDVMFANFVGDSTGVSLQSFLFCTPVIAPYSFIARVSLARDLIWERGAQVELNAVRKLFCSVKVVPALYREYEIEKQNKRL